MATTNNKATIKLLVSTFSGYVLSLIQPQTIGLLLAIFLFIKGVSLTNVLVFYVLYFICWSFVHYLYEIEHRHLVEAMTDYKEIDTE